MILHNFYLDIFIVIIILEDSKKLYNKLMSNIEILRLFICFIHKYILHFNMKTYNDIYPFIVIIQIIINNLYKDHTSITTSSNKP